MGISGPCSDCLSRTPPGHWSSKHEPYLPSWLVVGMTSWIVWVVLGRHIHITFVYYALLQRLFGPVNYFPCFELVYGVCLSTSDCTNNVGSVNVRFSIFWS